MYHGITHDTSLFENLRKQAWFGVQKPALDKHVGKRSEDKENTRYDGKLEQEQFCTTSLVER